jgi:flagellar motor protein MotB
MAVRARGTAPSPAGQDYLVSVSDLMSGLLFVFIITLAVFALRLAKLQEQAEIEKQRAEQQRKELTDSQIVRKTIVEKIEEDLRRAGVNVAVDTEHGIVRLTNETVGFARNQAEPLSQHRGNVGTIADVLLRVLRCYVFEPDRAPDGCSPDRGGSRVGTVMVEGHTDSVPILGGRYRDNLELSSARSAEVLRTMTADAPGLAELRNAENKPVLSVSGYGATRLFDENDPEADRNRRIDIRLLMELPRESEQGPVGEIRRELDP